MKLQQFQQFLQTPEYQAMVLASGGFIAKWAPPDRQAEFVKDLEAYSQVVAKVIELADKLRATAA
jgi:hypothetical protein